MYWCLVVLLIWQVSGFIYELDGRPVCKRGYSVGARTAARFPKPAHVSVFLLSTCTAYSRHPAYSVYISQLRYARICTSKVDFINRLCGLSLRPRQQGFETNLLQKSFNKFFSRHGLIVEKYGAALREMRLAIQAWIAPSYSYITYILLSVVFQLYLVRVCVQLYFERVHYLFIYLIYVYI